MEAEQHTLDQQIAPEDAQEVKKSEAEAQLYSALRDYPVIDELWADCISLVVVPLKADPD